MARMSWPRMVPVVALVAVVGALLGPSPRQAAAAAAPPVTVKLTVLEIVDIGDDADSLSDADFYVAGSFSDAAGNRKDFDNEGARIEGTEHIRPNWSFQFDADPAGGKAEVNLRVLDYDSGLNGGDDETANLTVAVDFRPCRVQGDGIDVGCGWDIVATPDDQVRFKVEVFLPPSSPGLNIRCLQDPLLPQVGQTVTITAEALDGTAQTGKIVDDLVIEVNHTEVERVTGATTATYSFVPNDSTFTLRCLAENDGQSEAADTWTRQVRVGSTVELAAPIAVLGSSARNIDVVLLADWDTYMGWQDANFQGDARDDILNGFYANPFVLSHQNKLNLWIAKDRADTDGTAGTCDRLQEPENWDEYPFADTGWIIHSDNHRDCAQRSLRIFGAWTGDPTISVHETGHSPFGLADEYCCDGGYFQADPLPNVYNGRDACAADAPSVGRTDADCRMITGNWFTSDPATDVMANDQRTFNALDTRRWNWLLDRCINAEEGC